jgi:hypothetical protein
MGVIVGIFACVAGFLLVTQQFTPQNLIPPPLESVEESSATTATTPPELPPPVVLAKVVETADIDPLLDPPEKPITGAPFDADVLPDPSPVQAEPVPDRIPPAVEDLPGGMGTNFPRELRTGFPS